LLAGACRSRAAVGGGELRDEPHRGRARWLRVEVATGFSSQSVAVLDGALYVGTQDAELYRVVGWP
jgi:hypothetical protein